MLRNSSRRSRHRPFDIAVGRGVAVDHALDAIGDAIHVGFDAPPCLVGLAFLGKFGRGTLAPSALEVAKHKALAAVAGEEAIVEAKVSVDDSERVETAQRRNQVEKPALNGSKRRDPVQSALACEQLFKDEFALGRFSEEPSQVFRLGFPRTGTALALEQVLNLGSVFAPLDKMFGWISIQKRKALQKIVNVIKVILDWLRCL
ncbi:hypothetical protein PGQ11_011029 [Apiospora arundinis]|uniref:Uncharacterized protein n=1 Tax=Apiospora arundinis TaxID=335852 RepID=A0ABR2HYX0_9PEZI